MGALMEKTGIADKLVKVSEIITGDMPGGLGSASVVACMFFAAISGSGPATVAAIGSIMIIPMINQGYDNAYAGSLLGAAATIGPVIPPSIPMIMYALTMGVSVTKMFTSGFFPGFVMGGCLILYNYLISRRRGYRGNIVTMTRSEKRRAVADAIPALLMPVIVLGGIYTGFFTPTECSVVGVVYSLLVGGIMYKELTWNKFKKCMVEAAITSSTVMVIFGSATVLGRMISITGISKSVTEALLAASDNPTVIMLLINGILLIIGMFLDTISSILLFAPLLAPIAISLGYDNVYFGVIMCVNLCIGMITPPMAANFYIGMRIGRSNFEHMFKETMPLVGVLCFALVLLILFPAIVTFLPNMLGM
jgi:C4-dicarboxylate transporter DctM subunit